MRLADLISLTFCVGWTEAQRFAEWTVRRSGSRVSVAPDPFGGAVVPIVVPMTEIPARAFRSDDQLRDACTAATVTMLRGDVAGR